MIYAYDSVAGEEKQQLTDAESRHTCSLFATNEGVDLQLTWTHATVERYHFS